MSASRMTPGDLSDTADNIRRMLAEIAFLVVTWETAPEENNLNELRKHLIDGLSHTEMLERAVQSWLSEHHPASKAGAA